MTDEQETNHAFARSHSNVGLGDELVLYVEKSRWEHLKKEAGNRFCIQAYTTVENENGFIKFSASPNV